MHQLSGYQMVIFGIIIIAVLILIIWIAYYFTAAYQQTLIIETELQQTYRYVASLNPARRYQLDSLRVEVTGKLKTDPAAEATIVPADQIQALIEEHIVEPYRHALLIHEASLFAVDESLLVPSPSGPPPSESLSEPPPRLRRCPFNKTPTLENLSISFFRKLAAVIPRVGAELVSVELKSGPIRVSHSRYKISNYTM